MYWASSLAFLSSLAITVVLAYLQLSLSQRHCFTLFFIYFLFYRSVVIHECRFSPENAQLQLEVNKDTCNPGTSCTYPFHSFFSSARQGDRKVITYHILPSTSDLEHALREVTQNCDTLGHLLSMLGASFPEIRNAISSFILSL